MLNDTQETETKTKTLRDERGRMLAPLPGGAPVITSVTARSMVQKRWENYRRKAVERIVGEAKSVDLTVSTGADAFGLVAAKQFSALMDSDKPRIADLEKLAQIMTGMMQQGSHREDTPAGAVVAQPETLLRLVAEIERHTAAAVDRARAVDAESTGA